MFKVCFFGLGSIGERHLKNLIEIVGKENLEIHAFRSEKKERKNDDRIKKEIFEFSNLDSDYDIVFITNPTSMHYNTMKEMKLKTKHMFIEKPLFDNISYNIKELKSSEFIYYVAAPLRYTGMIEKLKEILKEEKIFSVRAICSSYLPQWRPDQDYRKSYSAIKKLGGGVSIDLIHEWDYLCALFGMPKSIYNFNGKFSNLEIDSDDLSIYIAKYNDKLVELHLDYFGRESKRIIELFVEQGTIIGDFIKKEIRFSWHDEIIKLENLDPYKEEMKNFLLMIEGKKENLNNIEKAYEILTMIKTGEIR